MTSMVRRPLAIAVVAIELLAWAIWFIASLRDDGGEEDTGSGGVAVMPSDGGGTDPDRAEGTDEDDQEQDEASAASEVSEQPEITGDFTDPEQVRSEEHTSELQSRGHLVCRLLLEKINSTTC